MSTFKNIEKLGLSITTWGGDPRTSAVLAQELETLLQSAQVVKRYEDKNGTGPWWDNDTNCPATHSALLIGITPIKKKTKAEAALEFVKEMAAIGNVGAARILEMKDEV